MLAAVLKAFKSLYPGFYFFCRDAKNKGGRSRPCFSTGPAGLQTATDHATDDRADRRADDREARAFAEQEPPHLLWREAQREQRADFLRALLDAELEQQRHQHARRHDEEKTEPDEQPAEILRLRGRPQRLVAQRLGEEPDLGRIGDHCRAHPAFYDCGLIAAHGAPKTNQTWEHDRRIKAVAAATVGSHGEQLTDFRALQRAGAVAVTDDGRPILSDELMRDAYTVYVKPELVVEIAFEFIS